MADACVLLVTFYSNFSCLLGLNQSNIKACYNINHVLYLTDVTVKDAVAQLTAVKQTASNAFVATFSATTPQYTKDDIKVTAADASAELAVKSVEYSADKLSAVVTLYGNLKDATDYNVTCKESAPVSFKASVGEVTSIVIKTASAQYNVKTPIEFALLDATGIDVTPAKDIDSHCVVTVTGSYSSAELAKASEANITMTNVNDEAEVTVTYDAGIKGVENVTNKATIKCVKAEAVIGTTVFKATRDTNAESKCAKFYLGVSDDKVKVEENSTSDPVYFCAKDKSGDVISYDKYEAESSNDDVATVSVSKDSGKFAELYVTGNIVGTAQINITATKNGEASYYTIPVIVKKTGVAVKMVVDADYRTMSNSPDTDYKNNITAKFYDADGNEVKGASKVAFTSEITNAKDSTEAGYLVGNVFQLTNPQAVVAKTYNITVTGQDLRADKTFTSVIGVTVKKLPKDAWVTTGAAMTYQLKISKKTLDENSSDISTDVRVYANCNGLFAGYVDGSGAIANGNIHANTATKIDNADVAVKYGNEYYKASDLVAANKVATKALADENVPSVRKVTYNVRKANASGKYVVKANDNTTLAKTGTWTVEATLHYVADGGKDVVKTNSFSVKNSVVVPTVKVTTRNIDSLAFTDIQKVLKTNVDMNNDTSDYESITGLYSGTTLSTAGNLTATNTDGNKVLVKDAVVVDGDWEFYVTINTTFTVK
ncbi:MAG: hypothetical protein SPE81_04065 [Agathobacter sp.]|nr:hypothetical protein [Agathobacter sp.]